MREHQSCSSWGYHEGDDFAVRAANAKLGMQVTSAESAAPRWIRRVISSAKARKRVVM